MSNAALLVYEPVDELEQVAALRAHLSDLATELDFAAVSLEAAVLRLCKGNPLLFGIDLRFRASDLRWRLQRAAGAQQGVAEEIRKYGQTLGKAFGVGHVPLSAAPGYHRSLGDLSDITFRNSKDVRAWCDLARGHMRSLSAEMEGQSVDLLRPVFKAFLRAQMPLPFSVWELWRLRARMLRAAEGQHLVALEVIKCSHEFTAALPQKRRRT